MTLRLLTYNIERGGLGREEHLAAVINEQAPDVVVMQEATRPEIVRDLARATGMTTHGASRGRSVGFLSRVPIAEYKWVRPTWSQHAFLEIVPDGSNVRIFGVHLSAVHAAWTEARRVRELRSLLAAIKHYDQGRHVIVGDFNTLHPDERLDFAKLPLRLRALVWLSGGRIRWQTIAIMLGAGYVDGYRTVRESDPGYTFPTWDPHVRLDYVFLSKVFATALTDCEVVVTGEAVRRASDHFPVRAELSLGDSLVSDLPGEDS
jgi:endonuclease/exonuclease/phosphatase family metal-dependent hydrolase